MVMRIQPVANHNHMEIIPRTRLNARCQWLQRKQQQKERVDVRTKPWWQQPSSHAVKSSPSKPPRAGSMAEWKRPKASWFAPGAGFLSALILRGIIVSARLGLRRRGRGFGIAASLARWRRSRRIPGRTASWVAKTVYI